ncbi:expressed unknown protein [Seminavis robusta]|uniref:Uncharacterized protein n=1 Tax=Seminavis robusta TaxID=568900 RepID=A0A9N8HAG4_9STRA|nr:expressed unknown protein [Seminavis robusta]|eukprot:Sro295_g110400.1 n/a (352) ;mRNA; f:22441-23496
MMKVALKPKRASFALTLLCTAWQVSHAFTFVKDSTRILSGKSSTKWTSSELYQAYIFGDDDSMTDVESTIEDAMGSSIFSSSILVGGPPSIVKDHSKLEADKALLARLAAANPPTGTSIQLDHLEDVSILEVQETSIMLSAVVRNWDQCVTVAVPISFPSPCSLGSSFDFSTDEQQELQQQQQEELQECILNNLQQLDQQAKDVLQQQAELEANYEAIQAYKRQAAQLQSVEEVDFPTWWIPPSDAIDVESKSLRSLLNEDDFRKDVLSLAKYGIRLQIHEDYYLVAQAGIRSISATGLMLGALIRDPEDGDAKSTPSNTIAVDIPIPFQNKAGDPNQLRDNVLDMVETVA